jgi:hypothetical protein
MDKKVYDNLNDLYDVMVDVLAAIEKLDYRLKNDRR